MLDHATSAIEDITRVRLHKALEEEDFNSTQSLINSGIDVCWDDSIPNALVATFGNYIGGSLCSVEALVMSARLENRIHAALYLAEAFRTQGLVRSLDKAYFMEKSAEYEQLACNLFDKYKEQNSWSISKIHRSVLARKVWGRTPLNLAFEIHSTKFLSHPVVVKYLDAVTCGKMIVPSTEFSKSRTLSAFCRIISFLSSARGRHACFFCTYVVYLILLIVTVKGRPAGPRILSTVEITYNIFFFGFLLHEVNQVLADGPAEYFATFWNYLDAISEVFNCLYFCFRVIGIVGDDSYWSNMSIDTLACAVPFVMMRALFLLSNIPTLGTFLINVEFMFKESAMFLVIVLIVIAGFAQTNFYLQMSPLRDPEAAAGTYGYTTCFEFTFAFIFGNFNFTVAKLFHPYFGVTILMLVLLIGSLVLLSLLIAILNTAYVDAMVDLAGEYQLHRAKTILEYSMPSFVLPPINIVTLPFIAKPSLRLHIANFLTAGLFFVAVSPFHFAMEAYQHTKDILNSKKMQKLSGGQMDKIGQLGQMGTGAAKDLSRKLTNAFTARSTGSVWERILANYASVGEYLFDGDNMRGQSHSGGPHSNSFGYGNTVGTGSGSGKGAGFGRSSNGSGVGFKIPNSRKGSVSTNTAPTIGSIPANRKSSSRKGSVSTNTAPTIGSIPANRKGSSSAMPSPGRRGSIPTLSDASPKAGFVTKDIYLSGDSNEPATAFMSGPVRRGSASTVSDTSPEAGSVEQDIYLAGDHLEPATGFMVSPLRRDSVSTISEASPKSGYYESLNAHHSGRDEAGVMRAAVRRGSASTASNQSPKTMLIQKNIYLSGGDEQPAAGTIPGTVRRGSTTPVSHPSTNAGLIQKPIYLSGDAEQSATGTSARRGNSSNVSDACPKATYIDKNMYLPGDRKETGAGSMLSPVRRGSAPIVSDPSSKAGVRRGSMPSISDASPKAGFIERNVFL